MIGTQKMLERIEGIEEQLTGVQVSCSRFDEHEKTQNGQIADIKNFILEMREEQKQLMGKMTEVYVSNQEIKKTLDFNDKRTQGFERQFNIHCSDNKDRFDTLIKDISAYREKREKLEADIKEVTDANIKKQEDRIEHQREQIRGQKEDILQTIQQTLLTREENLASKVIWKMVLGMGSILGIIGAIAGLVMLFTR